MYFIYVRLLDRFFKGAFHFPPKNWRKKGPWSLSQQWWYVGWLAMTDCVRWMSQSVKMKEKICQLTVHDTSSSTFAYRILDTDRTPYIQYIDK